MIVLSLTRTTIYLTMKYQVHVGDIINEAANPSALSLITSNK